MSQRNAEVQAYFGTERFRTDPQRVVEVKKAIADRGFWEQKFEWRISTVRVSRIEPAVINEHQAFKVTVHCDWIFQCHCPTLERAVEYEQIFSQLIMDMFYTFGWPSWSAMGRLGPAEGDTLPVLAIQPMAAGERGE